jgi:hypothetical protein
MYIMAGLLFIGFLCNLAMKSVAERHYLRTQNQPAQ